MTPGEVEKIFIDQMPGYYEPEEVKAIAALVLQHVCHFTKSYYLLHKNIDLSLAQETSIIRILDELRFGKPVQHILGEADFFGLRFKVNPFVLVPRAETEELVDWILSSIETERMSHHTILDIGTGSACIPIALKKQISASTIFAMDISTQALDVANQNCALNNVEINLLQGDIQDTSFKIEGQLFDIIVSNPPYISYSEKADMHPHVLAHEPHLALFVPDEEPLLFYKAISDFALKNLADGGLVFLEINERYGSETAALFIERGFKTEIRNDLQGKDRMLKAFRI
ncbi:MAG: peptide chain release factor N(5)-glutamine methyltransferase [Pyrinomonadaceae bacterium]|nr:peptide chain release factor N(5)-glutamine methyltransferase [Sphingobacteriaceae bacterium]